MTKIQYLLEQRFYLLEYRNLMVYDEPARTYVSFLVCLINDELKKIENEVDELVKKGEATVKEIFQFQQSETTYCSLETRLKIKINKGEK